MAEWSKAPDSRLILTPLIGSTSENSGPRMRAWVQIPLLTKLFFFIVYNDMLACAMLPKQSMCLRSAVGSASVS